MSADRQTCWTQYIAPLLGRRKYETETIRWGDACVTHAKSQSLLRATRQKVDEKRIRWSAYGWSTCWQRSHARRLAIWLTIAVEHVQHIWVTFHMTSFQAFDVRRMIRSQVSNVWKILLLDSIKKIWNRCILRLWQQLLLQSSVLLVTLFSFFVCLLCRCSFYHCGE